MQIWVALLRGINVGGKASVPMKALRGMLEGLGYENVQTYIQSGNCVFRTGQDATGIEAAIGGGIEATFGFRPQVMAMTGVAFKAALAANPFSEGGHDPRSVQIFFLQEEPGSPDLDKLDAMRSDTERMALKGATFYLYAPDGIGRSRLAAAVERHLGVPATARNLRSAVKIAEML